MSKINPFILTIIKKQCDIDGNGKIEGEEVSIFEEAKRSYNPAMYTFHVNGQEYNALKLIGEKTEGNNAINPTSTVNKNVLGKDISFSYNQAALEDWVMFHGTDKNGNFLTRFNGIKDIRGKSPSERTTKEQKLLNEFDNLIKYVIEAGVDYGVDPCLILAIIQKETAFDGLSDRVFTKKGNGYMQLTTIAVKDMLGGASTKEKGFFWTPDVKTTKYGSELEELLNDNGFSIDCDIKDKDKLYNDIWKVIKDNPEFNIRIGTLYFRNILLNPIQNKISQFQTRYKEKYGEDIILTKESEAICQAAYRYNGNKKYQVEYAKLVNEWYNDIKHHCETFENHLTVKM